MPKKQSKMNFVNIVEKSLLYAIHPRYLGIMFAFNLIFISIIFYILLRLLSAFLLGEPITEIGSLFASLLLVSIGAGVIGLALKAGFIRNVNLWFAGKKLNFKNDISYSVRRLPGLILLSIILIVLNSIGYIFELVNLAILRDVYTAILAIIFWFAVPFLMIKKQDAVVAIKNSWSLFKKKYADMVVYWIVGTLINVMISTMFLAPLVIMTLNVLFGTANPAEIFNQVSTISDSPAQVQAFISEVPSKIEAARVPIALTYLISIFGISFTALFWYAYTVAMFRRLVR